MVWHDALLPGINAIRDLVVTPDVLVYGLADGPTFFVFDPKTRKLLHKESMTKYGPLTGGQAPRIMLIGPNGQIYALFRKAIVRINPETFAHEKIAEPPVNIQVGIALIGKHLFFSNGYRQSANGRVR